MTDLKKGIIEIDGFQIGPDTTPADIKANLKDRYAFNATSKDGSGEMFRFENVTLLSRCFKVKTTFIHQKIREIKLISYNKERLSYEDCFNTDCEWLKGILGDPDEALEYMNSYRYKGIHIYSFIQRDLSRNPAETFITCCYDR